jgi:hypothetical protein
MALAGPALSRRFLFAIRTMTTLPEGREFTRAAHDGGMITSDDQTNGRPQEENSKLLNIP